MSSTENTGSRTYTMVAGILMVALLAFGMLHTFGVIR